MQIARIQSVLITYLSNILAPRCIRKPVSFVYGRQRGARTDKTFLIRHSSWYIALVLASSVVHVGRAARCFILILVVFKLQLLQLHLFLRVDVVAAGSITCTPLVVLIIVIDLLVLVV